MFFRILLGHKKENYSSIHDNKRSFNIFKRFFSNNFVFLLITTLLHNFLNVFKPYNFSTESIYKLKSFHVQAAVKYWATYEFICFHILLCDILWRRKMMKLQTAVYLASLISLGTSYLILEECNKGKWTSLSNSFWLLMNRIIFVMQRLL